MFMYSVGPFIDFDNNIVYGNHFEYFIYFMCFLFFGKHYLTDIALNNNTYVLSIALLFQ